MCISESSWIISFRYVLDTHLGDARRVLSPWLKRFVKKEKRESGLLKQDRRQRQRHGRRKFSEFLVPSRVAVLCTFEALFKASYYWRIYAPTLLTNDEGAFPFAMMQPTAREIYLSLSLSLEIRRTRRNSYVRIAR